MECYTVCLIIEKLANLKLELTWSLIVPDSYSFINGASSNQIFLNTDIHALDSSGVEWKNCEFILAIIICSVD
jgi:hypothetical protein